MVSNNNKVARITVKSFFLCVRSWERHKYMFPTFIYFSSRRSFHFRNEWSAKLTRSPTTTTTVIMITSIITSTIWKAGAHKFYHVIRIACLENCNKPGERRKKMPVREIVVESKWECIRKGTVLPARIFTSNLILIHFLYSESKKGQGSLGTWTTERKKERTIVCMSVQEKMVRFKKNQPGAYTFLCKIETRSSLSTLFVLSSSLHLSIRMGCTYYNGIYITTGLLVFFVLIHSHKSLGERLVQTSVLCVTLSM